MQPQDRALYPGSFDPVTNGHLDIIRRAARVFDGLCVAVFTHPSKRPLFSVEERLGMLQAAVQDIPGVRVAAGTGLVVEYAQAIGARAVVRGVRGTVGLDEEVPTALMNRRLSEAVDTVFFLAAPDWLGLSSSLVKELAGYRASLAGLVPPGVEAMLIAKLNQL